MRWVTTTVEDDLLGRWRQEWGTQPLGWDFAELDDRMTQDRPDWDYAALTRACLGNAESVLDLGTGGGEFLSSFAHLLPADTIATEGWAPNVAVATRTLAPLGVQVVEYAAPEQESTASPLPFADERFDLVLNRHEAYNSAQVARVLAPGGELLTQQVGSGELDVLYEALGWHPDVPECSEEVFVRQARDAGLHVLDSGTMRGVYRFDDVAALLAYLRQVPWEVPDDFGIDRYAEALLRLHERFAGGPIPMSQVRFWMHARKPLHG